MKTIVLEEPGRFLRTETERPGAPGAGQVRVRVEKVGICGSDLHAFRGRQPFFSYPRVLGHELGVVVEDVGDGVVEVQPGARCAVEPYLNCGRCIACQQGKTNCCVELRLIGVHIDGGMRESILVPSNKLHESNVLQTDQLALVEMLGIGAHAVDRANLAKGETALVIGAGPIGLSVIQFAQIAGARVILMEVSQTRIAFCKSQFGVEEVIQAGENALGELRDLLGGELPTAVFDATGNPNSMNAAFQYVANGGRLVFVGLVQSDITFFDPEFHRREITLLATRNSLSKDFVRIVRLMEEGTVDTRPWITHGATFEDFVEQFPAWLEPEQGVVKAMLTL